MILILSDIWPVSLSHDHLTNSHSLFVVGHKQTGVLQSLSKDKMRARSNVLPETENHCSVCIQHKAFF